jgi:uncharacterized small protein (DUF1192 family)
VITDAQLAEWRANPHAGEHPAVVPALLDEIERLRGQLRPLDGSEYAVVMGTRTFEERVNERDALRAEIERLRAALLAAGSANTNRAVSEIIRTALAEKAR